MANKIPYKSFCWSLGTTSFRTKNFNRTIEEQLRLLDEFWKLPEHTVIAWIRNSTIQTEYYDFMKKKGFVTGDASNKPKDAREKTSGLADIGLIDDNRRLTEAGKYLMQISLAGDFSIDNKFQIPKDSYIYLRQLLKTSYSVNENSVRPFIVLIKVLSRTNYLTTDEFKYLLPLCIDHTSTYNIVLNILKRRSGCKLSINAIIIQRLMQMENYQNALQYFLNSEVDEDTMRIIGMNRKSANEQGQNYDKSYFPLYIAMYNLYVLNDESYIFPVYKATKPVKIGIWWRNMLFSTSSSAAISNNPKLYLKKTMFDSVSNEMDFKTLFFKTMHLFKAKATLSDYFDLNRRYMKTTDIVLFEDGVVKLDIIPKHFFNSIIDELYKNAYLPSDRLYDNCSLEEIDSCLQIDEMVILDGINQELGTSLKNIQEAYIKLEENRYLRLQHLIDNKFTDDNLLKLLDFFETRNDSEINKMVTDNADIPTIFEYVLGILWYKVSERQGKILDYMKLSLDADLLPKTHAAGGEADIVYEYEKTKYYPEHALLLEATLADGTNQRRMEMEPVSRHLGQHLIRTGNMNSYCVFATNFLHKNVIADFRGRKNGIYYDIYDDNKYVESMKIIPLETKDLKNIVKNKQLYKSLYPIFDEAYNADLKALKPLAWYETYIKYKL